MGKQKDPQRTTKLKQESTTLQVHSIRVPSVLNQLKLANIVL